MQRAYSIATWTTVGARSWRFNRSQGATNSIERRKRREYEDNKYSQGLGRSNDTDGRRQQERTEMLVMGERRRLICRPLMSLTLVGWSATDGGGREGAKDESDEETKEEERDVL